MKFLIFFVICISTSITYLQYFKNNMVKLSSYSNAYEQGKFELKPWEFWTEEERSQVIYQAYKDHYLTSKEIKKYLDVSKSHMYTQFVVPTLAAVGYFGLLKSNLAAPLYRRNPAFGFTAGVALVAATTIFWVNLNPFYIRKQQEQQKTLDILYHKIGTSMKLLNDLLPRTRTSVDIDVRTRMIYSQRNGILAGKLFADDDFAPPIRPQNKSHSYAEKKTYL